MKYVNNYIELRVGIRRKHHVVLNSSIILHGVLLRYENRGVGYNGSYKDIRSISRKF